MKRKIASLTILILVLGFAFTFAGENRFKAGCSNATLKGPYGIFRSGATTDGPVAAVGIVLYDGNGRSKTRQKVSSNGTHDSSVFSFEYKVAEDCTYKAFSDGREIAMGVVVNNGNRIFLMSLAPGTTSTSVLERIHQE